MELWNASSGVPTSLVASVSGLTANVSVFPTSTVNTYSGGNLGSIATTTLLPNTQYAIVLRGASIVMFFGGLSSNTYTATDGWTYVGSSYSSNSGISWTTTQQPFFFIAGITTLSMAPTAKAIPTLSEWSQMLLGLMVLTMIGWQWRKQQSVGH